MAGVIPRRILIDGSILTTLVAAAAALLLFFMPRLALSDYPEDVKAAVPPRTKQKFRQGLALSIPMLIVAIAIPLHSAWLVHTLIGTWTIVWPLRSVQCGWRRSVARNRAPPR
jgi:hypothetical protein